MYCLILFYLALKEDLAPIRPVPKFIVVKAVVFFTWWQSVLFAVLTYEGVIEDTEQYSALQVETALQDFVVCIEMVLAAVAHHYYFTYKVSPTTLSPLPALSCAPPHMALCCVLCCVWPKDFYDASAPLIIAPMFRSMFEVVNVSDVFVDDVQRIRRKRKHRDRKKEERRRRSEGAATLAAVAGGLAEGLLHDDAKDSDAHHDHDHDDDDDSDVDHHDDPSPALQQHAAEESVEAPVLHRARIPQA